MKTSAFALLFGATAVFATPVDVANQERDALSMADVGPAVFAGEARDVEARSDLEDRAQKIHTMKIASSKNYKTVVVNQHNAHRSNHSVADLAYSDTLAGYARTVASHCKFAHDLSPGGGNYGQNIAVWGSSGNIDSLKNNAVAGAITNQWYNDELNYWKWYGQDNPGASSGGDWGHFTQVVWKDSKKVGCSTVKCPAGTIFSIPSWFTVCNYSPPGNYGGEYGDNVFKPKGDEIWQVMF